jgi:hypothetical protein
MQPVMWNFMASGPNGETVGILPVSAPTAGSFIQDSPFSGRALPFSLGLLGVKREHPHHPPGTSSYDDFFA